MAAYSPFLSCGVGGRAASLYALLTAFHAPDHPSTRFADTRLREARTACLAVVFVGWWHVPVWMLACFWCARRGVGTFRAGECGECALLAFRPTCVLSRVWFGARGCGEDGMGEVIRWVER